MTSFRLAALRAWLYARRVEQRARQSHRKWTAQPAIAAEVLEERLTLSPSITSFFLLQDTGTAGDNVTADGTVAGTVSDPDWVLECVELDFDGDGLVDEWAYLNYDGSFEYDTSDFLLAGSVTIRARVSYWVYNACDSYLAYGNWTAVTFTYNRAPEITEFYSDAGPNNEWTFYGTVDDEAVESLTISFGGLLAGQQAIVEADGTFTYGVVLSPGTVGTVTVQTTDEYGEISNVEEAMVS